MKFFEHTPVIKVDRNLPEGSENVVRTCVIGTRPELENLENNGGWTVNRLSQQRKSVVSGYHCEIYSERDCGKQEFFYIKDTSTNGTWVNGIKIIKGRKFYLQHGALIYLG